jgi:hypothetical protein
VVKHYKYSLLNLQQILELLCVVVVIIIIIVILAIIRKVLEPINSFIAGGENK